ncbi:MAG: 23S rRNA (adenine(2503)-C(2))-methyltransferase RlmN [Deltaproteobacteria bacterium]|nr:23S rRNA (adenine(2503)-C(2))-methyltransferase RlmN [Deltaproteobacteria bacterium]
MSGLGPENRADLKGMNSREIEEWAASQGLEPYRGRQVRQWLLQKRALSFDEMSNLPKSLRVRLGEEAWIDPLDHVKTQVSEDGTRKYLFRLSDGPVIESVLIPERDHFTLCISSQAGCAMGCAFCLTTMQGLRRNLRASEIVEQVILVRRAMDDPDRLTNIVFMGMGEPLANYGAVLRALDGILAEDGMNFSHRRVTLSTCGLVPQIRRLGEEASVNLAVSLNAADDETRTLLMPVNRQYPLKELLSACRAFPLPNRRMITFEYILIAGINDRAEDAERLSDLLSDVRAKINLIPLNPHPGASMTPPSMEGILAFQEILIRNHYTAIIRKSKGQDISAACGQLSGRYTEDADL